MGRAPCCDKAHVKRGPWSPEEDLVLKNYIVKNGSGGNWISLPQKASLNRCGKSCRLRWLNYLRPDIKHGGYSEEEDNIICSLHERIGSRWSVIAAHLPGRTDNDVKNHWNTKLRKRLMATTTCIPTVYTNPTPSKLLPSNLSAASTTVIAPSLDTPRLPLLHPAEVDPLGAVGSVPDDILPFVPRPISSLMVTMPGTGFFSSDSDHVPATDPVSSTSMATGKGSHTQVHHEGMIDVAEDELFGDVNWITGGVHGFYDVRYRELVDCGAPSSSVSVSMSSSAESAGDLSSFTSLLSDDETNKQALCQSFLYLSY